MSIYAFFIVRVALASASLPYCCCLSSQLHTLCRVCPVVFSSPSTAWEDTERSAGSPDFLCGQPQSPGDEEQHREVQTHAWSDRRGFPGQREGAT